MSNHKIIFPSSELSGVDTELEVFHNPNNEISIWIECEGQNPTFVSLNRATAIKLTRVLKAEISKLSQNG